MYNLLSQNIQYLRGVGPARAHILNNELDVFTVGDLLHCFPLRYIDRSKIYTISALSEEMQYVQLRGQIIDVSEEGKGRTRRIEAVFADGTGTVRLVWFNALKFVKRSLKLHTTYLLLGKPTLFNGSFNMAHPELEAIDEQKPRPVMGLRPVYRVTEAMRRGGITSHVMEELIAGVWQQLGKGDIP